MHRFEHDCRVGQLETLLYGGKFQWMSTDARELCGKSRCKGIGPLNVIAAQLLSCRNNSNTAS